MFDPSQIIAAARLRRDVAQCSVTELGEGLRATAVLRAALDAFEARVLAAYLSRDGHTPLEASSLLQSSTHTSQREAARRVQLAEQLTDLPTVTEALAAGRLTAEHASALARATRDCPTVAGATEALVAQAERQPADQFERGLRTWVRDHSPDGGLSEFERQRAKRRLSTFTTEDGMTAIDVRLDPVAGATVNTTLDRLAERLWRADANGARSISLAMRRADALVELCQRATEDATTPDAHRPGPTLVVLIDHQTLLGQLAEHPVCELADGTPIPAATARRLACQAGILPMVLDGAGQPLDVGRTRRYPTRAQRAAVLVRDRSCTFPHCDRPPAWCDIHHVTPWEQAGRTDLRNLLMLCEHHHHLVHEGGWHLARAPDGTVTARSPEGTLVHASARAEPQRLALGA